MRAGAFLAAVLGPISLVACGGGGGTEVLGAAPPAAEWALGIGGSGPASGCALGVLHDGSVITVGAHDGDLVFNSGSPQGTALAGSGRTCLFVTRHDADGTFRWARCGMSSDYLRAYGAAVLPDDSIVVGGFVAGMTMLDDGAGGAVDIAPVGLEDGFLGKYDADGHLLWARTVGGAGAYVEILSVGALVDGSFAVAGLFTGPMTLGVGEANETSLTPTSFAEAFVARYAGDGTLMWARATASPDGGYATGWAVAGQPDLGVVVGGEVSGATVFDAAGPNETSVACAGSDDCWIARFDAAGQFQWVRRIAGAGEDELFSLTVADDGAVLAAGYFRDSTLVDADGAAPEVLGGAGGTDAFVAAFESDGTLRWARSFGGSGDDQSYMVRTLPDGSAILAGYTTGGIDGPLNPLAAADPTGGSGDAFVARFASDGSEMWARSAGGLAFDAATAIAVDPVRGNLFVSGLFAGPAQFDGGSPDAAPLDLTSVGETDAFLARFGLTGAP